MRVNSMYLFEKIDVLRDAGGVIDENLPSYISDNLVKSNIFLIDMFIEQKQFTLF